MTDRDYWTVDAMEKWGGSFVVALANLARHADPRNLKTIKQIWSQYWSEYDQKGRELEKADNALHLKEELESEK